MSVNKEGSKGKVNFQIFRKMKEKGQKISMLTAYDYTMAKLVDQAGIDTILVGDSAGNIMAGYETTLSITLDEIIYHAKSVKRAVNNAFLIIYMPFETCTGDPIDSLHYAIRIMRETVAEALKIEVGEELLPDIRKIIAAGIPVMGKDCFCES